MKKFKLFLAALAAMVGLSAQAQLTNGTVYWIQDAATGQFITRGGNWGTRAVAEDVGGIGFKAEYINDGVYKLQTVDRTLAGNTAYFGTGMYLDQNTQTEWSITASGEGYTISSGTQYLNISGKSNQQNQVSLVAAGEAAVWKFLTRAEYKAALAAKKNAEAVTLATTLGLDGITTLAELEAEIAGEDYVTVDQTSKIDNPTIADNLNGWALSKAGAPRGYQENNGDKQPGVGSGCAEFWHGSGNASQTVTGLPSGLYKITMLGLYRVHNSGNATAVGLDNSSSPAYVYANGIKTEFANWLDYSSLPNNRAGALTAYNNGDYRNTVYTFVGTDGRLDLGVMCASWNDYNWQVFGQFTLTQIYSIAMYKKAYDEAMAAATEAQASLTGFSVYSTQKSTLDDAITANTLTGDDLSDADKLTDAATKLNAAVLAVAKEKAACDQYASIASAIEGNTNVDLTSFVVNACFEAGDLTGWTSAEGGNVADNGNFGRHAGNWFAERWKFNTALGNGSLTHDDILLPAGVYQITADAQNIEQHNNSAAGTGLFLYGNSEKVEIGAAANYSILVKIENDKDNLVIKFVQDNCTGNWICFDNITLTYVGEDFPAYTLVDGKMSSAASTAQSNAETTFTGNKTVANYNALLAAIAAAQTSKDAYAVAASAVADAKALQTDNTFVTPAAATTFAEAIAAIETPYNEGSLADADANNAGRTLGVVMVDWHTTATNTAASNYMISTWPSTYTINDWSWEGNDDGSNFKVPFFQDWVADGDSLAAKTMTGTLTGLENGLYSVSAWVRVRAKNETAAADATGITMDVNGGGEGEYAAVDVTGGTQVGESQFQLATYEAKGLVKDGTLTLNFNIAADNNISWLAFKNIKYTKVRDLTPEEAAVFPTAIALYNGETEVTEVALDATNASVTLTPNFTPADATPSVTWTSSDETVATVSDGVITAVSSGTAIIAVKSTLDENVGVSATITVSFPESEVVSYVNDGATRMVYNLGENLIKNGSFEYSDNFYGWTAGNGAKLTSSNFSIETSGAYDGNNYLKAKQDNGQTGAGSIYTSWPVEAGKKYVFSYQMKNSSAVSNDDYIRTSLSATTTEDATSYSETFKAVSFGTDWTTLSYEFTVPEGKNYLVFSARWLKSSKSFDNFYLCEVLSDPTTEGNVQYALDAIPTANIGTGAFQYSQDAIDAANALVQGTATVEEVEAAHEAVSKLNEPEPTQAYNLVFNCEGHSATGNALTLIPNPAQTQGLYGLKYLNPANVNLAQAFYFTHTTGNKYKVHAIDTDLNERYITTQAEGYGTTWYEGIRTIDDASKAMEIEIRPNGEGLYLLWNTGANKPIAHNGNNNNDFFTNNTADFQFVETAKPSITINTTAAGWGTTMLPFAVAEIPEGVKVYTCAEVESSSLTLVEVDALEANKPYIIEGAWNATLTGDAQGTALSYTEGLLTGTYARIAAPNGAYILQKHDDKVGFFQVNTETAQPNVPANRAYLTAPTASGVKAFYLGENDLPTAIQSVFDGLVDGDAYDLAGRKVQKLQKGGVYIINGKKVVVK